MTPSYDTIVVGAGSAGAALAGRLSEDEGRRVLLLEAGPDYTSADTPLELQSVEPAMVEPTTLFADRHTYSRLLATRTSVQQPDVYYRGRGVGGSSSINGLFAIRATVEDHDGWAAAGCTGWSYDDVLPLLTRMEHDLDFGHEPYHGDAGPIPVRRTRLESMPAIETAVHEAATALGHGWAPDHNAPGSTGISPYAYNSFDTRRVSTNDAYLEPARARGRLTILGDAVVDRVLLEGGRAVGVRALVAGEVVEMRAPEVVLCAGTIHSPAVLMRSGIGPADELRALGIDPVTDLPVGHNLQEHAGLYTPVALDAPPDYGAGPRRGQLCLRFTTGVGSEVNDAMIAVVGALGIGVPTGAIVGWVNRVSSAGRVRLTSTDPTVDPSVDFNLLSHPDDMRRMRIIADELQAIAGHSALQTLATGIGLGEEMIPPGTTMSDREFEEFALANVSDTVHATSTCSMGDPDDPGTVVDPAGRVLGIDGLRVADASIMPWSPRANTNLPSILVGEKIADSMRTAVRR